MNSTPETGPAAAAPVAGPRSTAKRFLPWLIFGLCLVVFYFVADRALARLGTTFDWCSITQPEELIPGEVATIGIHYHDIAGPLHLVCHLRWQSVNREKNAFIWSATPLPKLNGSGTASLEFQIPGPDHPDFKSMHSAHVRLFLSKTPAWKKRVTAIDLGPPMLIRKVGDVEEVSAAFPDRLAAAWKSALKGRWQRNRGDNTSLGWLMTLAYFLVATTCLRRARLVPVDADDPSRGRRHRRIWQGIFGLLVVLGINKQLDLQILATDVGRQLARTSGWYWERRAVQQQALLLGGTAGLALLGVVGYWIRPVWTRCWLALTGVTLLLFHLFLRAVSFHHVDRLLGVRLGDARVQLVIEMFSLLLVGVAASRNRRQPS